MKKLLTLLITFMMLFSSVLSHAAIVYADEETLSDEETLTETVEVSEEENQEDPIVITEEESEEEGTTEEQTEIVEEETSEELPVQEEETDPEAFEEPDETAEDTIDEETVESDALVETPDETGDELQAEYSDGTSVKYTKDVGIVFTNAPWASAFMADSSATITLSGSEDFTFMNVHCTYESGELTIVNKYLKYANVTPENFTIKVSKTAEVYAINLKNAGVNLTPNTYGPWKARLIELGTGSLLLCIGEMKTADKLGDEDPWISTFRKYNTTNYGQWLGGIYTGSHVDIYDSKGNLCAIYYYTGKTPQQAIYFDDFYFLTHHHGIEIDLRALIDDKVPNGPITIKVCAPGYTAYTETIDLESKYTGNNANLSKIAKLNLDAPSDITITTTTNGDVVIDSSDKNFLKALAAPSCYYKSPSDDNYALVLPAKVNYIGGGYITVDNEQNFLQNIGKLKDLNSSASSNKTITVQAFKYIDDKNDPDYADCYEKVVIPNEFFVENDLMNGNHTLVLSAEGYLETTKTAYLDLKNEPHEIDASKINMSVSANGDLVIECTDSTERAVFYEMLTMAVRNDRVSTGGRILINNDKYLYNANGETAVITQSGNKLIIASQTLKDLFSGTLSGNTSFALYARTYNVVNKTVNLPYIVTADKKDDGSSIYFTVEKTYMVDTSGDISWSILKKDGNNYVALTADDKVSIEAVGNKCAVFAEQFGTYRLVASANGITDTKDITVTADGLKVTASASKADGVVGTPGKMAATAKINGTDDISAYLSYRSGDENIATVDGEGNITFLKMGTVDIYAYIADQEAKTTYSVYTYNKNAKLTWKAVNVNNAEDEYASGIEIGEKFRLSLYADGVEVDRSMLRFKSAAASVASVDDDGVVEGKKVGKANITIYLDDLATRSTVASISVINKVFYSLELEAEGVEDKTEVDGVYNLFFDADSDLKKTVNLKAIGTDKAGNTYTTSNVKFTSVDANIVSVTAAGVATIKKAGEVTVTATVTTNPKDIPVSKDIVFRILDLTPRLSANKVTINKYAEAGARVYVSSAYSEVYPERNSVIKNVSISGSDYNVTLNKDEGYFDLSIADPTAEKIKALKTGKYTLTVTLDNNKSYDFDFTVTVTAKKATVTAKTSGSFNTFTNEGSLNLTATSKDAVIKEIKFLDDWAIFDQNEGTVTLKMKDGKFVNKGTVRFSFEGYNEDGYVDKVVTFKTVATKPTVKLESTAVTLFVPEASEYKTVKVRLIDGKKNPINTGVLTSDAGYQVSAIDANGYATVKVPAANGKVALSYKEAGWNDAIKLTLNVKVIATTPSAKLASATLNYNLKYQDSASVAVKWSSFDDTLLDVVYGWADNEDGISEVTYADGMITVKASKAGTYKLTMIPLVYTSSEKTDYVQLKEMVLTVKVVESDPKITLKTSALKLNKQYKETLATVLKVPTNLGYEANVTGIDHVSALSKDIVDVGFDSENNAFTATLKDTVKNDASIKAGRYLFDVYPLINGKVSSVPIRLIIVLYDKAATAAVTLKGNLNQLDPSIEVTGTIKLSNIVDEVVSVSLSGASGLKAQLSEDGKAMISLTDRSLKDGTYKPVLNITTKTGAVISKQISVKVARKAATLKLVPSTVNAYDTTNKGKVVATSQLVMSGTVNSEISNVKIENSSKAYDVVYEDGKIVVKVVDAAKIKAGSTQTVTIRVDWAGDYGVYDDNIKGLKTTTLKLSIKDISGTIKSK